MMIQGDELQSDGSFRCKEIEKGGGGEEERRNSKHKTQETEATKKIGLEHQCQGNQQSV
jgi:hypothetical protein